VNRAAREAEVARKLTQVRDLLGVGLALRLRGIDWFAWITAGASSAVLLAAETGVAEVVVTREGAWVVTDEIEARRLVEEELPPGFTVRATAWAYPAARQALVSEFTQRCCVISDRPAAGEGALPDELVTLKRTLSGPELERYRTVGGLAAEAMTEALLDARPQWTELDLAGAGARALLARGLHPALILASGDRRLPLYRHPVPTGARLGEQAMLVFCARGFGLYANLTRFVSFQPLSPELAERHRIVHEVEARALELSRPGVRLRTVYAALSKAYSDAGYPRALQNTTRAAAPATSPVRWWPIRTAARCSAPAAPSPGTRAWQEPRSRIPS
jgi:Xaa-Pro aminopeptidase